MRITDVRRDRRAENVRTAFATLAWLMIIAVVAGCVMLAFLGSLR